ncbi:hypothetical protein [Roseibium sp.]|uniref:hypothetical protein n=1 Tax=Roseibium sp. TaxID=1936156 RepID=UPI003B520F3F
MPIDWSDKWLGLLGGGGSLFAGIHGRGCYQINLWNQSHGDVPIRALIISSRWGLGANIDYGHVVCLLTGVRSRDDFQTLTSSGVDWGVSLPVGKVDTISTTGNVLLRCARSATSVGARSMARWAKSETSKRASQYIMNDLELDAGLRAFYLLPTPLATGLGIWGGYDTQTMYSVGTNLAWQYCQPEWFIDSDTRGAVLRFRGIPEDDGSVIFAFIREEGWTDWANWVFQNVNGSLTRRCGIEGRVYNGQLYEPGAGPDGQDGIPLRNLVPVRRQWRGLVMSGDIDSDITTNGTVTISPSLYRSRNGSPDTHWTADGTTRVNTGPNGQIMSGMATDWQE